MNTQPSGTTDTVKDKIVAAIKGAGDIVQTTEPKLTVAA